MIKKIILNLTLASLSFSSLALEVNQPLPNTEIANKGEITLDGDNTQYAGWKSTALDNGKVNVVMYLAGRMASDKMIRPFTDALELEAIPLDVLHSTTIINLDDTLWGTSGFVMSEVKSNKKKHPEVTFILDGNGKTRQHWQLDEKSAAIIILDKKGQIAYLKQGAFDEAEASIAIKKLKDTLK
ncbi:hypothetical protein EDC56_0316 [Sinobacterium caligoides]|uniref:YtfJ family protein n=1 Tax=Sinobacterium caligoides TaxID=933926 RepID=A0A3N2DY84_9GAMM|nr:YtfJ family protein [Sinobacterium caligoides]ROS04803.1 hypothetical protein EDC56_0316 [Sinobacterium caligoides]